MTNTGSAIASLEARSRCTSAQRRKISWSTPAPTRSAASMSLSRRATTAAADRDRSNASRVSGSAILVFCPHQVDVLVPAQSIGAGSEESARCCSTCAPQRSPVPSTRATRGRSRSTLRPRMLTLYPGRCPCGTPPAVRGNVRASANAQTSVSLHGVLFVDEPGGSRVRRLKPAGSRLSCWRGLRCRGWSHGMSESSSAGVDTPPEPQRHGTYPSRSTSPPRWGFPRVRDLRSEACQARSSPGAVWGFITAKDRNPSIGKVRNRRKPVSNTSDKFVQGVIRCDSPEAIAPAVCHTLPPRARKRVFPATSMRL